MNDDYDAAQLRRLASEYHQRAIETHDRPTARILSEIADELTAEAKKLEQRCGLA